MKPYRSALGPALLSIVFLGGGIILPFGLRGQSPPLWFLSMTAGSTLVLMGLMFSILSMQVWAGWHKSPEPRGVRLGSKSLSMGAVLLALGVVSIIIFIQSGDRLPQAVGFLALKLSPILIALGIVLVRSSTVTLHSGESDSPGILTLGNATCRTGVVLCWMAFLALAVLMVGMIVPKILWKADFVLIFLVIDCLTEGLALIALGTWIQHDARSIQDANVATVP